MYNQNMSDQETLKLPESPSELLERMCDLSRECEGYVVVATKSDQLTDDILIHPRRIQLENDGKAAGNNGSKCLGMLEGYECRAEDTIPLMPDPEFNNMPPSLKLLKTVQRFAESKGYRSDDGHFVGKYIKPKSN